jgi:hypothetical protein
MIPLGIFEEADLSTDDPWFNPQEKPSTIHKQNSQRTEETLKDNAMQSWCKNH